MNISFLIGPPCWRWLAALPLIPGRNASSNWPMKYYNFYM